MADAGKQSKAPKGQASDVRYILPHVEKSELLRVNAL
jgi:hypothetical protein